MSRRVQWLGIKLPLSHPVISRIERSLTMEERKAIQAVENAGSALIVIPGTTGFTVGKAQGFSKEYLWVVENNYIEVMTDSDAAFLFKGGIVEHETFRDVDFQPHRNKEATYPSETLMKCMRVRNPYNGHTFNVTDRQAALVAKLFRLYRRAKPPGREVERVIGQYGIPNTDSMKRLVKR